MKTVSRGRATRARFADISALRTQLPRYWWTEVNRVRALIERDAQTALFEAEHFQHAARALHAHEEALAKQHAAALWAASRQLSAIARGNSLHAP